MDAYGWYALLFLGVGLLVLMTEVFIPSGGLLAIITISSLSLSIVCAYAAWFRTSPGLFYAFCGLTGLAVPCAIGGAFAILPRTSFGKRILLDIPDPKAMEPYAEETARLEKLVGAYGTTMTQFNPGGMVLIAGERHHAFTEGLMLEPQTSVVVLEVRATRLLVAPGAPRPAFEAGESSATALDSELRDGRGASATLAASPTPVSAEFPGTVEASPASRAEKASVANQDLDFKME